MAAQARTSRARQTKPANPGSDRRQGLQTLIPKSHRWPCRCRQPAPPSCCPAGRQTPGRGWCCRFADAVQIRKQSQLSQRPAILNRLVGRSGYLAYRANRMESGGRNNNNPTIKTTKTMRWRGAPGADQRQAETEHAPARAALGRRIHQQNCLPPSVFLTLLTPALIGSASPGLPRRPLLRLSAGPPRSRLSPAPDLGIPFTHQIRNRGVTLSPPPPAHNQNALRDAQERKKRGKERRQAGGKAQPLPLLLTPNDCSGDESCVSIDLPLPPPLFCRPQQCLRHQGLMFTSYRSQVPM